ncbi:MAG: hypothetical protein CVU03_09705 [Bacteroidetes bacterium HGW-Bacteroidetes-2]|jgi:O-antigen ligase|nr:MAG: hypothetical protein CVU03_09705 [Bacteroidetes bacterium HGW-Bacteroidetes-2]
MKILRVLFFFFGVLLPLSTPLSNGALIAVYITIAVLFLLKKIVYQAEKVKLLFLSVLLLFFLCLLSLLIAEDIDKVIKILGRRSAYLLTPMLFILIAQSDLEKLKNNSLKGLLLGSVISAFILIFKNLTFYFATRPFLSIDNELFNFYHTGFQFTAFLDIHPSYLGVYYLLVLSCLFFQKPFKNRTLNTFSFIIIILAIIFLASRIVYILTAFLFLIFLLNWTKNLFNTKLGATVSILGIILLITFSLNKLFKDTYLYERITKEAVWELTPNVSESYNTNTKGDSRVSRWGSALELFYEKPFFGYGVGSEKGLLEKKYLKNNLLYAAQNKYDTHNQYLSYLIESGVLGLVILLFFLSTNIYFAFKAKDIISALFIVSIALIGLVENFFNNNAGITFIAFFGSVFLFSNSYLLNKK